MTTKELRQKYLSFFESKGHTIISGASLLPENDPTVLFTTAGMHPLVPYLLGEKHPAGQRLVDIQKCIRTGDIEEVGDGWHLTFFEMLGNWSLGDYFKKEAIEFSYEFLTKELNIPLEKLAFTCFEGDENSPRDDESANIWKSLGVSENRIAYLPKEDNWWGPAGQTGPCGPDTEMFYWTGDEPAPEKFDPKDKRWVEIWNDVFMQYNKTIDGNYKELTQKNVDTGMGLERVVAVLNNKKSVYETEKLYNIILQITSLVDLVPDDLNDEQTKFARKVADHLRAATFILAEKIEPSNAEQGYVLRRLIRRAVRYGKQLGINKLFTHLIADIIIAEYGGYYKELRDQRDFIIDQLMKEEEKFQQPISRVYLYKTDLMMAINSGVIKKINSKFPILSSKGIASGRYIYENYQSYGVPPDLCLDIVKELGLELDQKEYDEAFKLHQETSRIGAEQKFKGGLSDNSETSARMHTATHLMLVALRKVLGDHVLQKGANITTERIRFDFSHREKMTPEQIKQVEDLVNEQIQKNLPVDCNEMTLDEAKEKGAMGVFEHKYGEKVKVYEIGNFSKEICGGPHAKTTGELGHFKIQKEESSSSGVRRIKAILE